MPPPVRAAGVLDARTDGMLVLLHPTTGQYYRLNAVGERVWQLCDGAAELPAIVDTVATEFDAPRDVVERDVRQLVGELLDEKLLTR